MNKMIVAALAAVVSISAVGTTEVGTPKKTAVAETGKVRVPVLVRPDELAKLKDGSLGADCQIFFCAHTNRIKIARGSDGKAKIEMVPALPPATGSVERVTIRKSDLPTGR